jgi:hypothetical protein
VQRRSVSFFLVSLATVLAILHDQFVLTEHGASILKGRTRKVLDQVLSTSKPYSISLLCAATELLPVYSVVAGTYLVLLV